MRAKSERQETGSRSTLKPTKPSNPAPSRAKFMVRALRHRNYRLFFAGQGVSLIGTWMTRIATAWLVYRLTNSAFMLGLVSFAGQIPTFLFSPFAGVMVDRWNRHRILVVTQVLSTIQSFALAWLTLSRLITVHDIIALSIFQGLVNALDMPGRQAFVIDMVESPDDLSNAIALNSSMFNGARLIGPSLAGIVIARAGEGPCFLIDGISYLAVIAALLAMSVRPRGLPTGKPHVLLQLKEGFSYSFRSVPIRSILVLLAAISLLGMPYVVLMPIFATKVLHGGANALGLLMAFSGAGALAGALYLASRKSVRGLSRIIPIASIIFGAGLIAFSQSHWLWLSLLLLVVAGFGMMVQMASSNTMLQTIVDDDKRGRVMSIYGMSFMGMAPFGSLLAGWLAHVIGVQETVLISGVASILAAAAFAAALPGLRAAVRPIYIQKGIIPEVTAGVQAATILSTDQPD